MRLNILKNFKDSSLRTHEGAPVCTMTPEQALRRTALSCLLWEKEFYESGVQIATRIRELVPQVAAERVAALAIEVRERMKLRHLPLLLVREMARHATHRALVADTLAQVIQRADELSEFVAIYWTGGKQPLSAQVKKGLAGAFCKFDEYALGKYDRAGAVRLRDVLFLSHARPVDTAQAELWKRLAQNELATPDTWEVSLSAVGRGERTDCVERTEEAKNVDKRDAWERLIAEHKLGALALLRNLRNMHTAGVREELVPEDGSRSAFPLSGGCAFRAAVGAGARSSDVSCARRLFVQASRAHSSACRCLWFNELASVAALGDASHRCGLRSCNPASRDCREGIDLHLLEQDRARSGSSRHGSTRCAGSKPAAQWNLSRRGGGAR